jgi:beta-phosphoglucomutase
LKEELILKAIFLDLDDVLVFSETAHTQAWEITLTEFGIDPSQIDFQGMVGISDYNQAAHFKQAYNIKNEVSVICELKRDTFLALTKEGFESAAGRNRFLETAAMNHVLAVVSSSPRRVIERVLSIEKIAHHFKFIIAHEDCQKHKPDPMPYQKALERAKVDASEAVVVEDSMSGITAAKQASIPVVGLFKNQRSDQILEGTSYYPNFTEIHKILLGDN